MRKQGARDWVPFPCGRWGATAAAGSAMCWFDALVACLMKWRPACCTCPALHINIIQTCPLSLCVGACNTSSNLTLLSTTSPHRCCFRWLSTQQEDGRICRELFAGSSAGRVAYEVTLVTSDTRGAGTDANVHVQLHGSLGDGVRHELVANPGQLER